MVNLRFTKDTGLFDYWKIEEVGRNTKTKTYEVLGFIFQDELGVHWNIDDNYSGIVQFEELEQIYNKMKEVIDVDALDGEQDG